MNQSSPIYRPRHPRFASDFEVRVVRVNHADGQSLEGGLADFSQSGARIVLNQPLPTGERISLRIPALPHNEMTLSATVAWSERTSHGRYQTGCTLSAELTPEQLKFLQHLAAMQPV